MARSWLRRLTWNDDERRPRAPWRLLLGAVVVVLAGVGGALAAAPAAAVDAGRPAVVAVVDTLALLLPLVASTAGILAAGRFVDRRWLRDFGLWGARARWADLGFGLTLGITLPAVVFALELAAGFVDVVGVVHHRPDASLPISSGAPAPLALALVAGYFVGVGVFEELLFRGYLLTNLAEGLDGWRGLSTTTALSVAAAASSLLFGVGHATNPSATALSVVVIVLYGGLLAASYLLTGRVAVAVGLHVGWNFAVSAVFGFPVSGFTAPVTLLAVEQSGPAAVTGGGFGPEGGLVALVALAAGAAALVWWVRREGSVALRRSVATPLLRTGPDRASDAETADRTNRGG